MNNLIFRIQKEDKWVVESTNGSKIEKTKHGRLPIGISSLFGRYPGILLFHLTIPATDTTKEQDFLFRKSTLTKKWRWNGREYDSLIKAFNGFRYEHPKLMMFYISIPTNQKTI